MFRIDSTGNINVMPTPAPLGTAGYFQDTSGDGGTVLSAEWLNAVQEELAGILIGLGGTLSKSNSGQIWSALGPHVLGVLSNATDTGTGFCTHTRALLASSNCRADGLDSAMVACSGGLASAQMSFCAASDSAAASGIRSAVIATGGSTASGAYSAVMAGWGSATGDRSALVASQAALVSGGSSMGVASKYTELHDSYALAGGYAASLIPMGTNQNLTWILHSDTGLGHFTNLYVGGNVNTGATPKVTLDGANGDVLASRNITATTQLATGTKFVASAAAGITSGLTMPTGTNEVSESKAFPGITITSGGYHLFLLGNSKIGASSKVIWSVEVEGVTDGGVENIVQGAWFRTGGDEYVVCSAIGHAVTADFTIHYVIINPA